MTRPTIQTGRVLGALLLVLPTANGALAADSEAPAAEEILAQTVLAYREVAAIRDSVQATVTRGGAESQVRLDYTLGAGADTELHGSGLKVISLDGRVFVTRDTVGDKYFEASLDGTLQEVLGRVLGAGAPAPLVPLTMRHADDPEAGLEQALGHFAMNLLGPLEIAGTSMVSSPRGRDLHRVDLATDGGSVELYIRPGTFFLTRIHIDRHATETDDAVTVDLVFDPEILDDPSGLIEFHPKNRVTVDSTDKLVATRMEAGEPAPALSVVRFSGGLLALPDLRGTTVVLDFFSTGCESCRGFLAETELLASWAQAQGLDVVFLAIDTLEDVADGGQARALAAEYVSVHSLSLPMLLDWNHELLITLGAPSVPTLYLIGPGGHIASFYDGDARPSLEALQAEILELTGR